MTLQYLTRLAAWIVLAAIVFLSLVPPTDRPVTEVPHSLEHAAIFFLAGLAFGTGYFRHERWLLIGTVAFGAGIELAQLLVPGRHARVKDFVVDVVAASIGVLAGSLLMRMKGQSERQQP